MISWTLFVPGLPKSTQTGSVVRLPSGRAIVTRRHTSWSAYVALAAQTRPPSPIFTGPLRVALTFYRPRLAKGTPAFPTTRPDLGNLSKGLLDALAGIVYVDDAQIVDLVERKRYVIPPRDAMVDGPASSVPGVAITVDALPGEAP